MLSIKLPALRSPMLETFQFELSGLRMVEEGHCWPNLLLFFHQMLQLPMQRVKNIFSLHPTFTRPNENSDNVPVLGATDVAFAGAQFFTLSSCSFGASRCLDPGHRRRSYKRKTTDPNHSAKPHDLTIGSTTTLVPINYFLSSFRFPSLDGLGIIYYRETFS